jgi:cellulose biosynthesis protein BcsQ
VATPVQLGGNQTIAEALMIALLMIMLQVLGKHHVERPFPQQARTRLSQEAREALEGLSLPVFRSAISQRIGLAEAPLYGKLILHYANNPAAAEFRSLVREILEVMHYGKEIP